MYDPTLINSLVALEFCLMSRVKSKIRSATLWLETPAPPGLQQAASQPIPRYSEDSPVKLTRKSLEYSSTLNLPSPPPPPPISIHLAFSATACASPSLPHFSQPSEHSTKWASGTHSQGASRNPKTHPQAHRKPSKILRQAFLSTTSLKKMLAPS